MLLLAGASHAFSQDSARRVYVTLWFDTEDYILPQDDDATKRLAEMLTRLGVRATFKIVGEKARVLESRGRTRRDRGARQARHRLPLEHAQSAADRRRLPAERRMGRRAGRVLSPRSAGRPRRRAHLRRDAGRRTDNPAARGRRRPIRRSATWAFGMYLDEADHVGIDDQPFYYGGMLNVFKMRSNLARMDLSGGASLDEGKAAFTKAYERLRAKGGGTISIYYHPNEWVHTEFWDAVNFRRGANPPRAEWKQPGTRPAAETETGVPRFRAVHPVHQGAAGRALRDGDRADDALRRCGVDDADASPRRICRRSRVPCRRRSRSRSSTGMRCRRLTSSACSPMRWPRSSMRKAWPAGRRSARSTDRRAPTRRRPAARDRRASAGRAFARSGARHRGILPRRSHRVPDEVWIGAESLSPADYLATLAAAFEELIASGKTPDRGGPASKVTSPPTATSPMIRLRCGAGRFFRRASTPRRSWSWRACRRGR